MFNGASGQDHHGPLCDRSFTTIAPDQHTASLADPGMTPIIRSPPTSAFTLTRGVTARPVPTTATVTTVIVLFPGASNCVLRELFPQWWGEIVS